MRQDNLGPDATELMGAIFLTVMLIILFILVFAITG